MSKAEERAQQYYDDNSICCSESLTKEIFIAGYEQAEQDLADKAKYSSGWDGFFYGKGYEQGKKDAEKDLALTWEDMQKIYEIICGIDAELESLPYRLGYQEYWEEVLTRFKKLKEESHD